LWVIKPLFGRKKKEGGVAGAFGMGCDELLRVTPLLLALQACHRSRATGLFKILYGSLG
jgi:hypothetical protein